MPFYPRDDNRNRGSVEVAVIGAGLAGASVAYALSKRGIKTIVFERGESAAQGSSGNPFGLFVPYVGQEATPAAKVYEESFPFLQKLIDVLPDTLLLRRHGALQLPSTPRITGLISRLEGQEIWDSTRWVPIEATEKVAGVACNSGGAWYEDAASLSPARLVKSLLSSPLITVLLSTPVTALQRTESRWTLFSGNKELLEADVVVVANAFECRSLTETSWLPTEQVRGQIIEIATNPLLQKLSSALCFDGYIFPEHNGVHLLGASYDHQFMDPNLCLKRSSDLIRRLCKRVPELTEEEITVLGGRVSYRTSTHDRLPYVGLVPTKESAKAAIEGRGDSPEYYPSLYISSGHGSRGLLSTPLGGELLAQEILQEQITHQSRELLRPWRAVYRLKKRREKQLERERYQRSNMARAVK